MCLFKPKQKDRLVLNLEEKIAKDNQYYAELLPTLTYEELLELAISVNKSSVCCNQVLNVVNQLELQLLEEELERVRQGGKKTYESDPSI